MCNSRLILEIPLQWNYFWNIWLNGTYNFSQITNFLTEVKGLPSASEVQRGSDVTSITYMFVTARAQVVRWQFTFTGI